ncbi:Gfo/Idh/MocA family protein [Ovoidimarina sediminis]|uniref:Gfo/Idh/MocA family protein n=1 Tax=Ovoidimarina sediminis TaxID=3079856 RepID=UPI00290BE81C|nr:Gfo/Idh/MocA family oxidoreductase [Rhodophyticola sp. MJ-SS7]MDU8943113.1 Gfo/Idh/MocA family oxidoreductase [Rhodophyticola sp. MJ-SS7]
MQKENVAVIGLGYFSQFHLAAWVRRPGLALAGATDPDPARRAWAAETHGVDPFDSTDALLAATRPAIVDIVAPPGAHAALIRQCLAPGRIIVCQKPFCTSLAEAMAITAEAEAAGTTLVIHENFRFQPWHRTIRRVLDAGHLGTVWQARFCLRPGDGRGDDAYLSRQPRFREMERLLIEETAVHFIDLFRWFFGGIETVWADLRQLNPVLKGEDAGLMVLTHEGGCRSLFDGNRLADHASDNPRRTMGELEIVGEGGTLTLDGAGTVRLRPFGASEWQVIPVTDPVDDTAFGGGCVEALITHVADTRDTPDKIENQARAYLPVIVATEAAYRADAEGRRITLPGTPA